MRGTEDAKRSVFCPSVMPAEAGIQGRPEACVEPRMRSVASLEGESAGPRAGLSGICSLSPWERAGVRASLLQAGEICYNQSSGL